MKIPDNRITRWFIKKEKLPFEVNFLKVISSKDRKIFILFFFMVLISKLSTMFLPYWGDATGIIIESLSILENNLIPPGPEHGFEYSSLQAHPPLYMETLAILFLILGNFVWMPRLLHIVFSFLGVFYTYKLGKLLFNEDAGIIAAVLLFFSPMYFAQSGIITLEIPLTALSVISLYYALKMEKKRYLFSASLLVLTKASGIIVVISVIIYYLISKKFKSLKELVQYCIPIFLLLLWFIYHYLATGWLIHPVNLEYQPESPSIFLSAMVKYSYLIFFENFRFLLIPLIIYSIFILYRKKSIDQTLPLIIFSIAFILFYITFVPYGNSGLALARYILPVFPVVFIFSSSAIVFLFGKRGFLILALLLLLSFDGYYKHNIDVDVVDTNLEYIDLVIVHKQAADYVSLNYPSSLFLTTWIGSFLEYVKPELYYVENPLRIKHCNYFDFKRSGDIDFILNSNEAIECPKETVNLIENSILVKRFESRDKFVEIYSMSNNE